MLTFIFSKLHCMKISIVEMGRLLVSASVDVGLILFLFYSSFSYSSDYYLYSNKNLKLCRDFLGIINGKPAGFYAYNSFYGLGDRGVSSLLLKPVDKNKFYKQYESVNREKYYNSDLYKFNVDENIKNIRSAYFSISTDTFITQEFDANFDGKVESFFLVREVYEKKFYNSFFLVDERNEIVKGNGLISFFGEPFFYDGRFYLATVTDETVTVSETSLPYKRKSGFYRYQVCDYRTKP